MPFELAGGSCGSYNFVDKEIVLLCFHEYDRRKCHQYDGSSYSNVTIQSNYDHAFAYFSKYEGNAFIVGDSHTSPSRGVQTEILVNGGTEGQSWNTLADYPFGSR